ncbi:deoxyribose-phosphate aldolase [Niveispirillum sp.]|uniref:deoxyribose-phosphate aldolase n=1 Tax=Niveispirillum sp. TaxID=1917217 RepID=UPI001B614122|nr:deoxyribose-phosphate aldolase [Niveispirillum sp.]MBP7339798.1 deoxyribose-phosphate aldolase [Niveispirillum sp.]
MNLVAIAHRALPLLDLTSLNDADDEASTAALCARAVTPAGPVAAVCLWPSFVSQAKRILSDSAVKVATVVNFPGGSLPAEKVVDQIGRALADGADEIDVVMPYAAIMAGLGGDQRAADHLAACRAACGNSTMKVILESGALAKPALIERAARVAASAGADFLKTSTGKVPAGATLGAARIMLTVCRDAGRPLGFKASGGIRDVETAAQYLALADAVCGPGWVSPSTFRFGASGLLDTLLGVLGQGPETRVTSGY